MNIKHETLSGMSLFKPEILASYLLHIPHAATHIPNLKGFFLDKVEENINLLTDWATDRIFDVEGIAKMITPFSRLFCDVERFDDASEPMLAVGRGFFYTTGYDGSPLRNLNKVHKESIYHDYYLPHHQQFYDRTKAILDEHGVCHIIDCHSFNPNPLVPFVDQPKSPDICLGTDPFHTPDYLLNYTWNYFTKLGYYVEVNNPYAGCIIPKPYFRKEKLVKGIMIEMNKALYMDGNTVLDQKVEHLRTVIMGYFEEL